MDNLINKYLSNNLTVGESEKLKEWLQEDDRNRVEFENIVAHLKHSDSEFDALREKIYNKVVTTPAGIKTIGSQDQDIKNKKVRFVIQVAAVISILLVSIFVLIRTDSSDEKVIISQIETTFIEKEALPGQKLTINLPDGTSVKLNSGSKLIYPKVFNTNERRVELEGEAFFDVVPNKEMPFRIETNTLNIKVVGTSFNVRSYHDDVISKIGVKSGTVMVSTLSGDNEVVLQPSQMALYSNTSQSISKENILFNYAVFGWMDKELVFNETSFDQVLVEISRWYGVNFEIVGEFTSEQRLTSLYKNPTLESVLTSLSLVYDYNFEIHDKTVKIMKN
ncbi:MAG: FecR family protein [Bacteroidota bacterium]